MALATFLTSLQATLSPHAQVLSDPSSEAFRHCLQRWSNLDLQVPAAIIKPATESDAVEIVKAASHASIPFVPVCGGHSPWSTIGPDGFVLDLTLYKSVAVDAGTNSVKVTGGVLTKELSTQLSNAGQCTALGNGNTVGVIPYCLGGGISVLSGLIGFGCDNILSARIITSTGTLLEVNAHENADLFWAIKGAGQFFGVVLELTLRTYPLSILGTPDGRHWAGNYIYPIDRAEEVCKVMETLMIDEKNITVGHLSVMAPPPDFKMLIVVSPHYIGDPTKAPAAFQALSDLGPVMFSSTMPLLPNNSDHLDFACAKGDFKSFSLAGVYGFKTENFVKVISILGDLLKACPDAGASGYYFEWHSKASTIPEHDSAFSHYDVYLWMNCLSWYHDAGNHEQVMEAEQKALAAMRAGQPESEYIDYPNCNRTDPVERRYRGAERLAKLKALKKKWDPQGVFTKQLL